MKFSIITYILKKKISVAEKFTGKNTTLPILSNILFSLSGQLLKLTATNLEIACVLEIETKKTTKEGNFCVPARTFSSYIQTLKPDEIAECEWDEGVLLVKTNTVKTKILTIPAKDFPLIPKIKKEHILKLKTYDFQESLKQILPAVSLSQLKPELHGIFISWNKKDHTLTLAATDTFRLAERKLFLPKEDTSDFSSILPLSSAQEIARFESESDGMEIRYGEAQIQFVFGPDEIISNTVQGGFPQYESIIPKKFETEIEVDIQPLLDAVRSTSFFSSKLQDIFLRVQEDGIEIHAENSEVGETTMTVPAKVGGKPLSIAFNYKFLLDGLSSLSGNRVLFSFNNETAPALMKSADHSFFIYLLMPIRGI